MAKKIEYWAVIWGTAVMILTGFTLWNPIAITQFLPGQFIPAAKTAHSAEALLAVLSIVVWHFTTSSSNIATGASSLAICLKTR
ncbi:MAG: hypothetical protein M5U34_02700 [Chloroflexi bacterium]|nr:hypothetical protein [Chloroflexota bacterium]